MSNATYELEMAVWAVAEGRATEQEAALVDADPGASRRTVARLVSRVEEDLESVRHLPAEERELVVADFEEDRDRLLAALTRLETGAPPSQAIAEEPPAPVQLQASWSAGFIVVWAGGRGAQPADNDELADRLEAIGGPALGWAAHADVELPSGDRAHA
ncbi:MAG: hypothetical protein M3487_07755, partial [Actinomycetota bacterium]|nr:hypothetical protein [Actinomycetota bacterium]